MERNRWDKKERGERKKRMKNEGRVDEVTGGGEGRGEETEGREWTE